MKILLVEDDLLLAKGTAKLIERLSSHQVQITANPEQVFKWCNNGEVQLILMDINLPGSRWNNQLISGTDLSRSLKENYQTRHIPIILLSAYAMKSQKAALLRLSKADEFWTKPITNYEKIIKEMEELFRESSAVPSQSPTRSQPMKTMSGSILNFEFWILNYGSRHKSPRKYSSRYIESYQIRLINHN